MTKLTERERILRTYRHQEIDRIAMCDSAWAGTVKRWKSEGMPEDTLVRFVVMGSLSDVKIYVPLELQDQIKIGEIADFQNK